MSIYGIIGISYKLSPDYFLEHPFMHKQESKNISEMRQNPGKIPLSRIGIGTKISNSFCRARKPRISDLIGMTLYDLSTIRHIGEKSIPILINALAAYDIKFVEGSLRFDPEKDFIAPDTKFINSQLASPQRSDDTAHQLRELARLTFLVTQLPLKYVEQANHALNRVIKESQGR